MALARLPSVTIPISAGLSEQVDELLLDPPFASVVENGVFTKEGVIAKRRGHETMTATGRNVLAEPVDIHNANGQLIARTLEDLYVYSSTSSRWSPTGNQQPYPCTYTMKPWVTVSTTLADFSVAYSAGLLCTVWREDGVATAYYSIRDATSGTLVQPPTALSNSYHVKVTKTLDGTFCILSMDANATATVQMRTIATATPTSIAGPTNIIGANMDGFEIYADGTTTNFVWLSVVGPVSRNLLKVNSSRTLLATSPAFGGTTNNRVYYSTTNDRVYTANAGTMYYSAGATLAAVTAGAAIAPPAGWTTANVYFVDRDGSGNISAFYDMVKADTYDLGGLEEAFGVGWVDTNSTVASGVSVGEAYNVRVSGAPFRLATPSARVFIGLTHRWPDIFFGTNGEAGIRPPCNEYLCSREGNNLRAAASFNVDRADRERKAVPTPQGATADVRYHATYSIAEAQQSEDVGGARYSGSLVSFDLTPSPQTSTAAEAATMLAGGTLVTYDGLRVQESCLLYRPTIVGVDDGGLAGQEFNFCVVLKWTDNAGKIHRMQSNIFRMEMDDSVNVVVELLRPPTFSVLDEDVTPVADIYATKDLLITPNAPLTRIASNIPLTSGSLGNHTKIAASGASLSSGLAGADIPLVFISEGELETATLPGAAYVLSANNRVWMIPSDAPGYAWPSKPLTKDYAPEFNENLAVAAPGDAGNLVALAALEDKIILLGEKKIYFIAGDGPDATGAGEYLGPEKVRFEAGCTDPSSVVSFVGGVIFRSDAGFMLLDAGLNVTPITAPEDTLSTLTLARALPLQDRMGILFASDSGTSLWWDYQLNAWSKWTTYPLDDVAYVGGLVHRLQGGNVFRERTDYQGAPYMKIRTPWLKPGGSLEGQVRVWWLRLTGKFYSGDIQATLDYNYSTANNQVVQWRAANITDPLKLRVKPHRQKLKSIRVTIEETAVDPLSPPADGAGFTISGLTFELGGKSPTFHNAPTSR